MIVQFSKYHGTGNDFIMVDGRGLERDLSQSEIAFLCRRRFGIGSDGLIILQDSEDYDFRMRYYNADGKEGSMCGNGGRCIVAYARDLGLVSSGCRFEGIDGLHGASILPGGEIRLGLKDVQGIRWLGDGYLLDTGSPHYVRFVEDLENLDVEQAGREIRHESRFGERGVNVNFVQWEEGKGRIFVRTFERGVEAETYSCGTGVTAAAICAYYQSKSDILSYHIRTLGGNLQVSFHAEHHNSFREVFLSGPAAAVFKGKIELVD